MAFGGIGERLSYIISADPKEAIGAFGKVGKAVKEASAQADVAMANARKRVEELTIAANRAEAAAIKAEARATKAAGTNLEQATAGEAAGLRAKANRLGADLSGAKGKLNELEGAADGATGSLGRLGTIGSLGPAAIVAGAAAAAAGIIEFGKSSVETFDRYAEAARQVQLLTSGTAEESSKLAFTSRILGVDINSTAVGLARLAKNTGDSQDKLREHNVEIAKNSAGHIDLEKTLENVADAYVKAGGGAEGDTIANAALGRSYKDLLPLLREGSAGLRDYFDQAKRQGFVFDQRQIDAAHNFAIATRTLGAEADHLKVSIGSGLVPELTAMAYGIERVIHDVEEAPKHLGAFADVVGALGKVISYAPEFAGVRILEQLGKSAADTAAAKEKLREETLAEAQAQEEANTVNRAAFDAQNSLHDSANQLADAQQAVGDALQQQADDAQAVKDASDAITEAQQAATDAAQAETDARDRLSEAQAKLNKVRADAASVDEELARDELDLQQKIESVTKANLDARKAQDAVNLLKLRGAGADSLKLQEAEESLAEAKTKQGDATLDQHDAEKKLADARAGDTKYAKDLKTAEDAVATASRGVESAHRAEVKAVQAIDKARENYAKTLRAQRDDNRRLEEAIYHVQRAAESYADAQAKADGRTQASVAEASAAEVFALGILANTYPQVAQIVTDSVNKINAATIQLPAAKTELGQLILGTGSSTQPSSDLTHLMGFQHGGLVPGPVGKPHLAVVHGGETVSTPSQAIGTDGVAAPIVYDIDVNVSATGDEEAIGRAIERRLLISIPRHR